VYDAGLAWGVAWDALACGLFVEGTKRAGRVAFSLVEADSGVARLALTLTAAETTARRAADALLATSVVSFAAVGNAAALFEKVTGDAREANRGGSAGGTCG
jgi:hypothetical protein